MFKRLRQLHISLAAKCQLLFGTAVAAIIFAALFVPFQRIEQLTEQLNERAAAAVADAMVSDHVARQRSHANDSHPITSLASTTLPVATGDPASFPPPRLVSAAALAHPESLTKFEALALTRFAHESNRRVERRYYDGGEGFRYAQALYATDRCITCHGPSAATIATVSNTTTKPSTAPATQPTL